MDRTFRKPFKLFNKIQHYDWGTRNDDAFIPRFVGFPPVKDLPYAELWIGAHPSAPSEIIVDGQRVPLDEVVRRAPHDILGEEVAKKFDNTLPFLLKVLSAGSALSIQTHPDKEQAARLHASDPAHYPDNNHKPEIAIALESLEAIAGFRPTAEILDMLRHHPEIADLAGDALFRMLMAASSEAERAEHLKLLYATMMKAASNSERLRPVVGRVVGRLLKEKRLTVEDQHFIEQYRIHGADVGLFSFFFLNDIQLKPGQAIFTDAGIPHAYLKGNIVECMANSDNVVRAGLTTKFKDVDALLQIVTYRFAGYSIMNREQRRDGVVYRTSAEEFQIAGFRKEHAFEEVFESPGGPFVVLVTEGSLAVQWEDHRGRTSEPFRTGESFLIPAVLPRWRASGTENVGFYVVTVPPVKG